MGCYISFRTAVPIREGGGGKTIYHPIIVVFVWYIVPYCVILVMRYMHMYFFLSLGEKNNSKMFRG